MRAVSALEFASALRKIGQLGGRQMDVLAAHYNAPGRAATTTDLARQVGYEGYKGVNLCYGNLAAKIETLVGVRAPDEKVLLLCEAEQDSEKHWVLTMRAEFAEGLRQAGWV
jgi:hypothetical protein